jgi:hypothetical protein
MEFWYWRKWNNQWRFRNKLAGFDYSVRYFEITDALEAYKQVNIKEF